MIQIGYLQICLLWFGNFTNLFSFYNIRKRIWRFGDRMKTSLQISFLQWRHGYTCARHNQFVIGVGECDFRSLLLSILSWYGWPFETDCKFVIQLWNVVMNTLCVLCQEHQETCQHLFFRCRYSGKIWKELGGGNMKEDFTLDWNEILEAISRFRHTSTEGFLIHYTFQALVHSLSIWIWLHRYVLKILCLQVLISLIYKYKHYQIPYCVFSGPHLDDVCGEGLQSESFLKPDIRFLGTKMYPCCTLSDLQLD